MSSAANKPSAGVFWISVLGIVACFLLFLLLMSMVDRPLSSTSARVPAGLSEEDRVLNSLLTPAERKARLNAMREQQTTSLHSYGWIDQENGVVRLPIEQAIDLVIPELRAQQAQPRQASEEEASP